MTIETRPPISRRGLLAAVMGGTAAAIAGVMASAERAFAAGSDGEPVVVGGSYGDVRTATTLARQVDVDEPIVHLEADTGDRVNTTDLGARGVLVESQTFFTGRSTSRLRPGILTLTTIDRFAPDTRTEITSESVTSPSVRADAGEGVAIQGDGSRGGSFGGDKAQIRLKPSNRGTHPASGRRGDLFVDAGGRLWFCRGGRDWARLA
jgi:hypothetical protein